MKTYQIWKRNDWGNFLSGRILTKDTLAKEGIASKMFDSEQLRILALKPLDQVFTVETTETNTP